MLVIRKGYDTFKRSTLRRAWRAEYPYVRTNERLRAGLAVLEQAGMIERDDLLVHVRDWAGLEAVADSERPPAQPGGGGDTREQGAGQA